MLHVEAPPHTRLWRGSFAAVLAVGMAAATFSQYVYGVLGSSLIEEFEISRSQLGLLTTAAFVVGAICSPGVGSLVDRFGGRRVFLVSMVIVVVATLLMSIAPFYWLMLAGSALGGTALCSCNPTTNKLIAAHLPPGERGVVMGFKQAGVQVGAFFVGAALPALATAFGWRVALASTIVLPLAAAGASFRLFAPDAPGADDREGQRTGSLDELVWWVTGFAVLMGAGVATIGTYLPLYAHEQLGFTVGTAGLVIAVMGGMGIVSRIIWGWIAEKHGRFALPLAIMGVGSMAATLLIMAADFAGGWLLWVAILLVGATAVTWNVVGMLAIVAEVDNRAAGLASGYVQTGFYIGFVVSPPLFGYVTDRTGDYKAGWSGVVVVFALATAVALLWHIADRRRAS